MACLADRFQRRVGLRARGDGETAARPEGTAAVEPSEIGWLTLDRIEPGAARLVEPGHRFQQRDRVGMARVVIDRLGAARLHDAAGIHDVHAGGIPRHDPEIVRQLGEVLKRGNEAADAGSTEQLARLNAEFHERLAEASRNAVLSDVMRGLRERTSLAFAINGRSRAREDWAEHAGILAAVIAGDAELAALLATRHVHNAAAAFARSHAAAKEQAAD